MNEPGTALIWSTFQVTGVAALALALLFLTGRRDARTGAWVLGGGLAACVFLTFTALLGLPSWWAAPVESAISWFELPPASTSFPPGAELPAAAEPVLMNGSTISLPGERVVPWLRSLLAAAGTIRTDEATANRSPLISGIFVGGVVLCLLRLLLGLRAVRGWRQRSAPVRDTWLLDQVRSLQAAFGCKRTIEVRVCPELAGPATLGWLRPLLLLPADWRAWTAEERKAVLAHELAHVRAADYLTGLLARFSVALHFYHPLVWLLANRLSLQQELAADATAAAHVGGRQAYLRTLAQLALRQEDHCVYGPARAFLPAHGTLLRRIAMLRNKDVTQTRNDVWLCRGFVLAVLLGGTVALSTIRGPAALAVSTAAAETTRGETGKATFDLSYIDDKALGVLAARPAVCLSEPGMKPLAEALNLLFQQEGMLPLGFKGKLDLKMEDIDQIVGELVHTRDDQAAAGQRNSLLVRLNMIRVVRPFAWKQQLETALGVPLVEERLEGQIFWKAAKSEQLPAGFLVHLPDDRTLVMPNSKEIHQVLRRGKGVPPKLAASAAWKEVEGSWLALAIQNQEPAWVRALQEEGARDSQLALVLPLLTNTRSVALGVKKKEGQTVGLEIVAACEKEEQARAAAASLQLLSKLVRGELERAAQRKDLNPRERTALEFGREMTSRCGTWFRKVGESSTHLAGGFWHASPSQEHIKLFAEALRIEVRTGEPREQR